jgi:hypothetical protein
MRRSLKLLGKDAGTLGVASWIGQKGNINMAGITQSE